MATFVDLRHPVTLLVTDSTAPDNLNNDLHNIYLQSLNIQNIKKMNNSNFFLTISGYLNVLE